MAHLGSRVSALLDGRLGAAEEERCWQHVQECHSCRDLVEREGWVKTRLAQLSFGTACAPDDLKTSLRGRCGALDPQPFPTGSASRSRSRSLVAIGGGAAGACVVGVLALGLGSPARVEPRPPATDLSRLVGPVAPTLSDSRQHRPLTQRLVAVREKMAP
jgi:anti-sigma factor RsiW